MGNAEGSEASRLGSRSRRSDSANDLLLPPSVLGRSQVPGNTSRLNAASLRALAAGTGDKDATTALRSQVLQSRQQQQ